MIYQQNLTFILLYSRWVNIICPWSLAVVWRPLRGHDYVPFSIIFVVPSLIAELDCSCLSFNKRASSQTINMQSKRKFKPKHSGMQVISNNDESFDLYSRAIYWLIKAVLINTVHQQIKCNTCLFFKPPKKVLSEKWKFYITSAVYFACWQ